MLQFVLKNIKKINIIQRLFLLQMKMRQKRMQQVKFQLEERPNALKLNPVLSTPPSMQTQATNNKKENEITIVMEIMNKKQRLYLQRKFESNVFNTLKRMKMLTHTESSLFLNWKQKLINMIKTFH